MKPKRIILVRHGESQGNADPNFYRDTPDYTLNLTDLGRRQAEKAGHKLSDIIGEGTVRAYISPWYRSRQTFEEIARVLGDRITSTIEDPRIREQEWGHFIDPETIPDLVRTRRSFSLFYYRMPDGESGADVFDRISTFMETMHRNFEREDFAENALIITHGMTLRIFLMRWFHWSVEYFETLRNPKNCDIIVMELQDDGRYQLITPLATWCPIPF